jgi:hypothetical protein
MSIRTPAIFNLSFACTIPAISLQLRRARSPGGPSPQGVLDAGQRARPSLRHAEAVATWYGAVPLGLAGTCAAARGGCRRPRLTGAQEGVSRREWRGAWLPERVPGVSATAHTHLLGVRATHVPLCPRDCENRLVRHKKRHRFGVSLFAHLGEQTPSGLCVALARVRARQGDYGPATTAAPASMGWRPPPDPRAGLPPARTCGRPPAPHAGRGRRRAGVTSTVTGPVRGTSWGPGAAPTRS